MYIVSGDIMNLIYTSRVGTEVGLIIKIKRGHQCVRLRNFLRLGIQCTLSMYITVNIKYRSHTSSTVKPISIGPPLECMASIQRWLSPAGVITFALAIGELGIKGRWP